MLRLAVFMFLGVVVTYGQSPHHCIVHPELTFRASQFNHNLTTFREYATEYDSRGQRVAFVEKERQGTGVQQQWIIILFQEQVGFDYNLKTKACTKFHPGPFFPFGVPPQAHFEAEFYLGGPGEDMEAVEWAAHDNKTDLSWRGVFSRMNCFPVRFWERNDHKNHSLTTNVYDLVEGIADPSAFIPPQECLQDGVQTRPLSDAVLNLLAAFFPFRA